MIVLKKDLMKRIMMVVLSSSIALSTVGCGIINKDTTNKENSAISSTENVSQTLFSDYDQNMDALQFDNSAWNYDEENDVYWQIGVNYCSNPETTDYETMGIYVPGAYMISASNGDGTYTCTINTEAEVNGYTAETAPIVFPVNTAGYSAQAAPTSYSYSNVSEYMESGFIYVFAGMRGRSNGYDSEGNLEYSGGAPWGVTDLKAAVRYYRFNSSDLPGNTDSIFTFGHSGGGAQSSLMGATGDSELYYEYLTSIGAAMYDEDGNYISDAITGAMAWCPITSLDYANEAYEWNMGQYSTTGTRADDTWTSALSDDLSEAFANYINKLGLKDTEGNTLTLEDTEDGIYTSGSYYNYILSVIEESLNNFLSDTTFPYTESSGGFNADGGFGGGGETPSDGGIMPSADQSNGGISKGDKIMGELPDGELPMDGEMPKGDISIDGIRGNKGESKEATTYETVEDYIASLNSEEEWVTYDSVTNTAKITSIEDFAKYIKTATKNVGAFDDLDRSQAENMLFGNDENDSLHFDTTISKLLSANSGEYSTYSDWNEAYVEEYSSDLEALDKLGNSITERMNMYNPMYFISDYYEGYGTSNVAKYWRIHTGIEQGDTALTVETNLALALEQYEGVEGVEFETVWGQGHTMAERTGDSTENFINWVNECVSE
ncbi:MAG: Tannase [uncultured Clostridium sp.]